MPSDPHSFDEIKLRFIFVPHGEPEPPEVLGSYADWIKLPATLQPNEQSALQAERSAGAGQRGGRGSAGGASAPPDPGPPQPPDGNAMPGGAGENAMPGGAGGNGMPGEGGGNGMPGEGGANAGSGAAGGNPDITQTPDDPIAAYRRANDGLKATASGKTTASGQSSGHNFQPDAPSASDDDATDEDGRV
jgi:hypothetical protein